MKDESHSDLIKKAIRRVCLSSCLVVAFISSALSQSNKNPVVPALPEKIYLQLDSKVYTTDQTIWFKAVVTESDLRPTTLSGVLHVDLINPNGVIAKKQLIKLEEGIGAGSIPLMEFETEGRYQVRAYTAWNENFGPGFIFQEYVSVFSSTQKGFEENIVDLQVTKRHEDDFLVHAKLKPLAIDSLHKGTLNVYLTFDDRKDSLALKKNSAGDYALDYVLHAGSRLGTLHFVTQNHEHYTKTFVINGQGVDLQFFPEGGNLVHGLVSKVAFKALDYTGKGKQIEGEIINKQGTTITSFKSNSKGMGVFFMKGDTALHYYAMIKSTEPEHKVRYQLPDPITEGHVLGVRKMDKEYRVTIASQSQPADSIYLRLTSRNEVYQYLGQKLSGGSLILNIPARALPEGIVAITLLDKNKQPRIERLIFNERENDRLHVSLSADSVYRQRDKTTIALDAGDQANLSVLVLNKDQFGSMQSARETIVSRLLVSSELRGEIEDPGYYFRNENESRWADMDALLLTQGWSKYVYSALTDKISIQPESNLYVSGTVGGVLFKEKKKEGIELTMMTFGKPNGIQAQTSDSLGRFHFDIDDAYGDKLNYVIQTKSGKDEKKEYTITVNEEKSPNVLYKQSITYASVVDSVLIKKQQERSASEAAFRIAGANYLDEVNIKAQRVIPEREKMTEEYGTANIVIDGKDIQAKEEKWSYGLYSVIMFKFPGEIRVRKTSAGWYYAYVQTMRGMPTIVVIDGIPITAQEYRLVQDIPPSEVVSFEVIKYAKNFPQLFGRAFPEMDPIGRPQAGNVISIYTVAGKGLYGTVKAVGISQRSIPAFAPPRQFYSPSYEKLTKEDWAKPDLRGLIHWQPQVKTDDEGNAEVSFYNADVTGDMLVVVEAIGHDGRIGYQEMVYRVKKKQ